MSRNEPDARVIFRNTMRITPGHSEGFRRAIVDAVAFAEQHAPQLMVDVFIDEEHNTATSFQPYPDSDAELRHWELSDPYIVGGHAALQEHPLRGLRDAVRRGPSVVIAIVLAIPRAVSAVLTSTERTASPVR